MSNIGNFIGGKNVEGKSGRKEEILKKIDGKVKGKVDLEKKEEVSEDVEKEKDEKKEWDEKNKKRRVRVMRKLIEMVEEEYERMEEMIESEKGKKIEDERGEIKRGIEVVEVWIGEEKMIKGELKENEGKGIEKY